MSDNVVPFGLHNSAPSSPAQVAKAVLESVDLDNTKALLVIAIEEDGDPHLTYNEMNVETLTYCAMLLNHIAAEVVSAQSSFFEQE